MKEVRYGHLTYLEIKEKAEQDYTVIIPTGCTEQQGPHTAVDFDTWFAEELMVEAAQEAYRSSNYKALVLPALPFGPTPEHTDRTGIQEIRGLERLRRAQSGSLDR